MEPKKKNDQWIAAEEEIESQLLSGERLLWAGPCVRATLRGDEWMSLISMGFVLAMLFFFILPNFRMASFGAPAGFGSMFSLFPLLMVAFLLFMLGRIALGWWERTHTLYAVTNQRIIQISQGLQRRVKSIYPNQMQHFELVEHGNGVGDLILGYETRTSYSNRRYRTYRVPYGLLGIDNVRRVEALVLENFGEDARRKDEWKRKGVPNNLMMQDEDPRWEGDWRGD